LLGIKLVRLGVAEIGEHAVAHVSGDGALVPAYDLSDAGLISPNNLPHVLRIEACRKCCRAHQIAEHHGEEASLRIVRQGSRHGLGPREPGPIELGDSAQHLATMAEQDAEVLKILLRQIAED